MRRRDLVFLSQQAAQGVRARGKSEPSDLTPTENEDPAVKQLHAALLNPFAEPSMLPLEFKFFSSSCMAEQQGRFTVRFRVDLDHTASRRRSTRCTWKKIIIPHKAKPDFLSELRRMNITAAALFPGVDGLGRSIAERLRSACVTRLPHAGLEEGCLRPQASGVIQAEDRARQLPVAGRGPRTARNTSRMRRFFDRHAWRRP